MIFIDKRKKTIKNACHILSRITRRAQLLYSFLMILIILNGVCYETTFAQKAKPRDSKNKIIKNDVSKNQNIKNNKFSETTFENFITNKNISDTQQNSLVKRPSKNIKLTAKQPAGKKKMPLKTAIYIFDTIVSALMNLLVGTGAFMIVLIILKWFFLERRVDK